MRKTREEEEKRERDVLLVDLCVAFFKQREKDENQQKCMSTTARFQIFDYYHPRYTDHSFVHRV